jgi:hypothetical protein
MDGFASFLLSANVDKVSFTHPASAHVAVAMLIARCLPVWLARRCKGDTLPSGQALAFASWEQVQSTLPWREDSGYGTDSRLED